MEQLLEKMEVKEVSYSMTAVTPEEIDELEYEADVLKHLEEEFKMAKMEKERTREEAYTPEFRVSLD